MIYNTAPELPLTYPSPPQFALEDLSPVSLDTTYKTELHFTREDMEVLQMPIHM